MVIDKLARKLTKKAVLQPARDVQVAAPWISLVLAGVKKLRVLDVHQPTAARGPSRRIRFRSPDGARLYEGQFQHRLSGRGRGGVIIGRPDDTGAHLTITTLAQAVKFYQHPKLP